MQWNQGGDSIEGDFELSWTQEMTRIGKKCRRHYIKTATSSIHCHGGVNEIGNKTAIYSTYNGHISHLFINRKWALLQKSKIAFFCPWFSTIEPDSKVPLHSTPLPSAVWGARNLKHSNVQRIQMPASTPLNQCFNNWQLLHLYVQNFARRECPALPCPDLFLKYFCVEPLEVSVTQNTGFHLQSAMP